MITSTKHMRVKGTDLVVLEDYKLIKKTDRAGSDGKNIKCPICEKTSRIYNLAWSTLNCLHCNQPIDKYDWMIDQLDTWRTPR